MRQPTAQLRQPTTQGRSCVSQSPSTFPAGELTQMSRWGQLSSLPRWSSQVRKAGDP